MRGTRGSGPQTSVSTGGFHLRGPSSFWYQRLPYRRTSLSSCSTRPQKSRLRGTHLWRCVRLRRTSERRWSGVRWIGLCVWRSPLGIYSVCRKISKCEWSGLPGCLQVDSDWLLLKGESRKALRSADFRHKKDVRRRLLMFRWCEGRTQISA